MRILLMFDLPVKTKALRKVYADFHRRLIKDGFDMLQFSIYSRYCSTYESASLHVDKIKTFTPEKGSVRYIIITEKQYSEMGMLLGKITSQEKINDGSQLAFF